MRAKAAVKAAEVALEAATQSGDEQAVATARAAVVQTKRQQDQVHVIIESALESSFQQYDRVSLK